MLRVVFDSKTRSSAIAETAGGTIRSVITLGRLTV